MDTITFTCVFRRPLYKAYLYNMNWGAKPLFEKAFWNFKLVKLYLGYTFLLDSWLFFISHLYISYDSPTYNLNIFLSNTR